MKDEEIVAMLREIREAIEQLADVLHMMYKKM